MSDKTEALAAYETVQKAVADMKRQQADLQAQKQVLLDNKNEIYRQPLPKEDVKQFIFEWIDRLGQMYLKRSEWPKQIERIANPPRDSYYVKEKGVHCKEITLLDVDGAFGSNFELSGSLPAGIFGSARFGFIENLNDVGVFCFLFGDLLKEKLEVHFDDFYPHSTTREGHSTIKQRREQFAVIDAELNAVESEIFAISQQLRRLGQRV